MLSAQVSNGSGSAPTMRAISARSRFDCTSRELKSTGWSANGATRFDPRRVVPELAKHADQVDVAVVLPVGGPLGRLGDVDVDSLVLRQQLAVERHAFERCIPERRVVHAGFPRMPDLDETAVCSSTLPVQVRMPGGELRQELLEEDGRPRPVARQAVDLQRSRRVDRGLDDSRGPRRDRRVRRALRLPEVGAGEVASPVREHDVRQQAVAPLPGEERAKLRLRPLLIPGGVADRDAGCVPAPLVRIETTDGGRRVAEPVRLQHRLRPFDQLRVVGRLGRLFHSRASRRSLSVPSPSSHELHPSDNKSAGDASRSRPRRRTSRPILRGRRVECGLSRTRSRTRWRSIPSSRFRSTSS